MALANWFQPQNSPGGAQRASGPVQVGWFLVEPRGGVIYAPPERVRSADVNKNHAKSASRCPAVINLESRYFVVRVPFDLRLRFARDKDGKPGVRNMLGDTSPVRGAKLNSMIHVTAEKEWRYPDRPTIQISLPYCFIADEPVYMSQVGAFMHFRKGGLPGTIFGGRFPIHIWPRPLMWAFEWHDTTQDISLRRGEPWFYCLFETEPQDRPVQMVENEVTPELKSYLDHVSGAVNFVNQTFGLFKTAEQQRPATLIQPVNRS